MLTTTTALKAGSLALGFAMLAAPQARAQGTPRERMACMSDAMRVCADAVPDVGRIEMCLRRNRARISAACQIVLGPDAVRPEIDATGTVRQR